MGVVRLVAGVVFCSLFGFGRIYVSVFACHATGLDAVQRLDQKKHLEGFVFGVQNG